MQNTRPRGMWRSRFLEKLNSFCPGPLGGAGWFRVRGFAPACTRTAAIGDWSLRRCLTCLRFCIVGMFNVVTGVFATWTSKENVFFVWSW